jgi:hypothetical protein
MLSRSEEIALTQQRNAVAHNELALSLQSKLQSIIQTDISKLVQDVGTFDASLVSSFTEIPNLL